MITLLASIAASESVKLFVVGALLAVEVYRVAKQRKTSNKEKSLRSKTFKGKLYYSPFFFC